MFYSTNVSNNRLIVEHIESDGILRSESLEEGLGQLVRIEEMWSLFNQHPLKIRQEFTP